jgi:hypothetical protein
VRIPFSCSTRRSSSFELIVQGRETIAVDSVPFNLAIPETAFLAGKETLVR